MNGALDPLEEDAMAEEMAAHLAAIRTTARGDLRRELDALYLLAVERETLAVVGYGGVEIQSRVERLEAEPAVRAVVARALRWASREEHAHVVLARGLLARTGGVAVRVRAFAADLGGLVAGWSSAVLQHTRFRQAPASHALARIVTVFGRLAGKVPRSAASALRAQSFTEFCRFQISAELTAVVSWERIAAVLELDRGSAPSAPVALRIAGDEWHHRAMLSVLLAAFDGSDRLREGHDASSLSNALSAVDPSFVGPARPGEETLGRGGTVYVREASGARAGDPAALRTLLHQALVETGLLARLFASAPPSPRVVVKTTFMMSYDRGDPSPHVDVVLAEALGRLLREHGASDVAYLEAPNQYDRFFGNRSVAEVARYVGLSSEHYRIVDASEEQVAHTYRRGFGQESVSRTWRDGDLRIAFGKMRTHPSWLVHLTLSSLESLGRRVDELIFHDRQADLMTGLMMLLDAFPPHLALLDATHHVPDGLTGILGDPAPSHPGRLYAARDALALDLVAARHMGIREFPRTNSLALALDWFDDPRLQTIVDGPDTLLSGFASPHRNDLTVFLSALAYPAYLCGDNRGSLWVPVMDPQAFPLVTEVGAGVCVVRAVLRRLFGFGRPPPAGHR